MFSICIGGVLAFLLNVLLIESVIIPDICYYHTHDTNFFIDTFYDFPSSEGGHPVPSIINIILSLTVGGIVGFLIVKSKLTKY